MDGVVGPSPPRAYPARIASLARAPFAVRKGRWWWLMGCCCGKACGPAPPRALTLDPLSISPRNGERERFAGEGMIVVDDGVAAVVGGWLFSWSPPRRPSSFTSFQILHILDKYLTSFPRRREPRGEGC